jgi:hypothetical protein
MKGNCLAFDAFGQWFEHEGNKMRWMKNVGGEWRPRLCQPAKMGGRLTGHILSLFPLSSPLTSSLAQPPPLWCIMEELWPHGLAARQPTIVGWPPLGAPIKGLAKGSLFLHSTSSQAQVKSLNPSPSSMFAKFRVIILVLK